MRASHRSVIVSVLVAILMLWAMPAGAVTMKPAAGPIVPALASAPADPWEAGAGDDIVDNATVLATIPTPGQGPLTQNHTIDTALLATADFDWFKFTVTDADVAAGTNFLIEALTTDAGCDTFIELYHGAFVPGDPIAGGFYTDPDAWDSNDDDPWGGLGSALEITPAAPGLGAGDYFIRIRPYAGGGYVNRAGAYTLRIQKGLASRVAGTDRIGTALAASRQGWDTSTDGIATLTNRTCLIANAFNYADALAGAPMAGSYGEAGPILLSPPDHLPAAVIEEIKRLGVEQVYVLGGPSALSDNIIDEILAIDPMMTAVRLYGANRIETSVDIARELYGDVGPRKVVFLAYAYNYPDALAAGPIAVANSVPILLTGKDALAAPTVNVMDEMGVTDVVILGGTSAVGTPIETALKTKYGADHVLRFAGSNRYSTARMVADWACNLQGPGDGLAHKVGTVGNPRLLDELSTEQIAVASGETFPDALSAATLCGSRRAPLLLTPATSLSPYIYDYYGVFQPPMQFDFWGQAIEPFWGKTVIMGGTSAVSVNTTNMLEDALGQIPPALP